MFNQARLKLTLWYLLILMSVTLFFSFTIHNMLMRQVSVFVTDQRFRLERRFGRLQSPENLDKEFIEDANHRIVLTLLVINGSILLVAGGLGYFLAGKTLEPIQEMMDEQYRFVTDSSHELRTPLTSLKLAMEVALRNNKLSLKEARENISENLTEVIHLQKLSDRLLRLTSGQKDVTEQLSSNISISDIISESIKSVSVLARNKSISIENQMSTVREIIGNSTSIKELFDIILENAIKYSPEGSKIKLMTKDHKKSVDIFIKDQGLGIEAEDLPHIFDRFYRGDQARSATESGGFGLGLSIAKKIVLEHQGSISVRSQIGKGTTFIIHLPV